MWAVVVHDDIALEKLSKIFSIFNPLFTACCYVTPSTCLEVNENKTVSEAVTSQRAERCIILFFFDRTLSEKAEQAKAVMKWTHHCILTVKVNG